MIESLSQQQQDSVRDRAPKRRLSGLGDVGHRRLLLQKLIPALVIHPFERLTFISVARVSGTTLWVLRKAFGNVHNLLRAASSQVVEDVLSELERSAPESISVMEAITHYAYFLADKLGSECYRNLLVLMIRDGTTITSIKRDYRKRVIGKIIRDLEETVLAAGQGHGITTLMKEGACERFHRRIETAFALPALLATPDLPPAESKSILTETIKEAFDATFVFEWEGRIRRSTEATGIQ